MHQRRETKEGALPDLAPVEELVVPRQAAPENERALRKDVGRSGPHG
jgi:hypothetical protein